MKITKLKKGFTLIELLAAIVILAIIALIAVPIVLGIIEKTRKGAAKSSTLNYIESIEKASVSAKLSNESLVGEYEISELADKVNIKGSLPSKGNIIILNTGVVSNATLCINNYKISYTDNKANISANNCDDMAEIVTIYKDNILNGADPVLGPNIIPVTIANDGTVKYANINSEWYDYTNKEWANAVKLISSPSKTYTIGETILESDIQSYFVWIPRYKYKIFDLGIYSSVISSKPATSIQKTIEIKFETKDIAEAKGDAVGSYLTHPAFTTLDTNGIWVGKFETGYNGATSAATAEVSNTDSTRIIVKPNIYSWRSNTIYNMFLSSYNYDRNNDSHIMKNTEWGAVAYLSQSSYGINKEININNNSSFKTGYSALTTTNQTTYQGTYGDDSTFNQAYNTTTGYLASTTGNISGIYDMSGGAHEYVSSYMSGANLTNSGFTNVNIATYDSKYFDVYSSLSTKITFNYRILGDATGEMGPFYNYADSDSNTRYHNSWYAEFSNFVESSYPWFIRGGCYYYGVLAGQLNFYRFTGNMDATVGSRLVLSSID